MSCGLQLSVCRDPKGSFLVDTATCYADRALQRVKRKRAERAEKTRRPEGADDGVFLTVASHEDTDRERG